MESRDQKYSKAAFALLDLPYVPLLRVMRHLDEKSLRKAQLACRSMRSFINRNRVNMVATKIVEVQFDRVRYRTSSSEADLQTTEDFVEMTIYKTSTICSAIIYFPVSTEFNEELQILEEEEFNEDGIIHQDPWEWMPTHFTNVHIRKLSIERIHFTSDDVFLMEKAFQKKKVRVDELHLLDCIYNLVIDDLVQRFLLLFAPEHLRVIDKNFQFTRSLTASIFQNYISSLRSFTYDLKIEDESAEWIQLPSNFYKLPPLVYMGNGVVTSMGAVRKALQEWSHNRLKIKFWYFILPPNYADEDLFVAEVGLPCELRDDGSYSIQTSVTHQLFIRRLLPARPEWVNKSYWNIAVNN